VEVLHSGVQGQNFLCTFPLVESLLMSLLAPYGTVGLLDAGVPSGRGDHLLMFDVSQVRDLPECGSAAPQLIGVDALLMESFLDIAATQRKAIITPDGVPDDTHRKTVAVRLGIGHGGSAYPELVEATQPLRETGPALGNEAISAWSAFSAAGHVFRVTERRRCRRVSGFLQLARR